MNGPDYVYHGHLPRHHVAFAFAVTPSLANEAVQRHDCNPLSAHLLGRALNAGALCMHRIRRNDKLNLHWIYEGALRNVLVDLRGDGRIRGLVSPAQLPEDCGSTGELYGGAGRLNVVHSRGRHTVSSGTVPCEMAQLIPDLEYFFCMSEQVETALNVMIGFNPDPAHPVHTCQGFLLQALPGCDLLQFDRIRQALHADDFRQALSAPSQADGHFEELLNRLLLSFGGPGEIHMEQGPAPRWFCTCSREKFELSIRVLPETDRREMVERGESITVRCDFCNTPREFSPADISELGK